MGIAYFPSRPNEDAIEVLFDLPDGLQGIVGLCFLRCFRRWGAEQDSDGGWRFFLETDGL